MCAQEWVLRPCVCVFWAGNCDLCAQTEWTHVNSLFGSGHSFIAAVVALCIPRKVDLLSEFGIVPIHSHGRALRGFAAETCERRQCVLIKAT